MANPPCDCILPSSSSKRCLDRFSILGDSCEDENGLVSSWPLLQKILEQPVLTATNLVDVLDTISNTLRGSSGPAGDYGTLKRVVQTVGPHFFSRTWPAIVRMALKLPEFFPGGKLEPLKPGRRLKLSTDQVAGLVAHQFLCTLDAPSWRADFYDFSIWYDSSQRHPVAVEMYLRALFTYFDQLGAESEAENEREDHDRPGSADAGADAVATGGVEYSLHSLDRHGNSIRLSCWRDTRLAAAKVVNVESYTTEQQELHSQGPKGAVVISANKDIGFGQSATQEELYVGNCPEACPAVLVTPTLRDDHVLVVNGARPMLRVRGQRREISWSYLAPGDRRGGKMLFMDALEIDELGASDGKLPDLAPENLRREIDKAYAAFSSWAGGGEEGEEVGEDDAVVWTGIWGCGAFNGDPAVKMCALWIAASLAGKQLRILCDRSHGEFPTLLARLVEQLGTASVQDLKDRLDGIPKTAERLDTIRYLLNS